MPLSLFVKYASEFSVYPKKKNLDIHDQVDDKAW